MALIKFLKIECTKCQQSWDIEPFDEDFDDWVEREDEDCPGCLEIIAEKI